MQNAILLTGSWYTDCWWPIFLVIITQPNNNTGELPDEGESINQMKIKCFARSKQT